MATKRTDAEEAFLNEYEALCRKHGLSLGHEDGHGAFQLEPFSEFNIGWVRQAHSPEPPAVEPARKSRMTIGAIIPAKKP